MNMREIPHIEHSNAGNRPGLTNQDFPLKQLHTSAIGHVMEQRQTALRSRPWLVSRDDDIMFPFLPLSQLQTLRYVCSSTPPVSPKSPAIAREPVLRQLCIADSRAKPRATRATRASATCVYIDTGAEPCALVHF